MKLTEITLSFACVVAFGSAASATIVDNTNLANPPGWYNGTGAINGGFTVDTENGVEAGLRASIRGGGGGPITPVGTTYYAPLGTKAGLALWNFDYSVNPGATSGTYAEIMITNLGNGQSFSYQDNPTDRGLIGDATSGNGYQNSENLNFAAFQVPLSFNPNTPDDYAITLTVFEGQSDQLASVSINVDAVPEPSTWAMMIIGFLGLGFMAHRRQRAVPHWA
jgi:hypothetical protein